MRTRCGRNCRNYETGRRQDRKQVGMARTKDRMKDGMGGCTSPSDIFMTPSSQPLMTCGDAVKLAAIAGLIAT
jgi:hypothetical protein